MKLTEEHIQISWNDDYYFIEIGEPISTTREQRHMMKKGVLNYDT